MMLADLKILYVSTVISVLKSNIEVKMVKMGF